MMVKFAIALLVFSAFEKVLGTDMIDVHENPQEKPANQKGRLSLQNTGKRPRSAARWSGLGSGPHASR